MNKAAIELRETLAKLVALLTSKGLTVTQRGSQAYVDIDPNTRKPKSVNIPHVPENADDGFIKAIQGFVDHEVAHVLFTDYEVYGGGRSTNLKSTRGQQLVHLHNIMEDTFIERNMVDMFPGSRRNLRELHEHFLERVTTPALAASKSDGETLSYLFVTAARALSGNETFQEYMDAGKHWENPMLKELLEKVEAADATTLPLLAKAASTTDTLKVSKAFLDILYPEDDKPDQEAGPGNGTGERDHSKSKGKPQKGDKSEKGGKPEKGAPGDKSEDEGEEGEGGSPDKDETEGEEDGADGEDEKENGEGEDDGKGEDSSDDDGEDDGEKPNEEKGESDERPEDQESTADATFTSEFSEQEGDEGGGIGSSDSSASMFDLQDDLFAGKDISSEIGEMISEVAAKEMTETREWLSFTREFDEIKPLEPTQVKDKWVTDMEEETRQMTSRMQKDIERMMASQSFVISTPGHRRGRLHTPSLYKLGLGEDRIFRQKQEHVSKDTAVTLLVDNSGSMTGARIKLAMIASFALATTLERVKINHEVIGFTTGHYSGSAELNKALRREYDATSHAIDYDRTVPLVMPIYKAFGERISPLVKRRFAYTAYAQAGLAGNIDGESLQIASERLMRQPEKRKVILVLSDGQPAGGRKSGSHLKAVVKDLNKAGIDCIGIGIQDDSVKHYYERHVVLHNTADLPNQVMSELKKILA